MRVKVPSAPSLSHSQQHQHREALLHRNEPFKHLPCLDFRAAMDSSLLLTLLMKKTESTSHTFLIPIHVHSATPHNCEPFIFGT